MDFKILRAMSVCTSANSMNTRVKIGNDKKLCMPSPKNVGFKPLAVVIIRTAKGMQSTFSGRITQLFTLSYFYRSLPTFHEDHRSPLDPCYYLCPLMHCLNLNSVTLKNYSSKWCRRKHAEPNALSNWKGYLYSHGYKLRAPCRRFIFVLL